MTFYSVVCMCLCVTIFAKIIKIISLGNPVENFSILPKVELLKISKDSNGCQFPLLLSWSLLNE